MAAFGYRGGDFCINWCISSAGEILSPLLSIAGFCALWNIKELFEQEKRLRKDWFAKKSKSQIT